jgi:phosphatidylinositol phospholipase C beta
VVLPQLASLRLAAFEDSGKFIGHRIIPVVGLCPGYRHVVLRNEMGQPLPCGTLFLKITVKDYVPDGLSNFAEALANPIKFQSDLDKRTKQLAVFADEMDQSVNPDDVSLTYYHHSSTFYQYIILYIYFVLILFKIAFNCTLIIVIFYS